MRPYALFYICIFLFFPLWATNLTWQEKTTKDLEYMAQQIEENHPGICPQTKDQTFLSLFTNQKKLIPDLANQAQTKDDYKKIILHWIESFNDSHLYIRSKSHVSITEEPPAIKKINQTTYIVSIPSFKVEGEKTKTAFQCIEKKLKKIKQSKRKKIVVFDIRGNRGGNSNYATKIFTALTGITPDIKSFYKSNIKENETILAYRNSKKNYEHFAHLYDKVPNPFLQTIIKKFEIAQEKNECLATINFLELTKLMGYPAANKNAPQYQHQVVLITDQNNKSAALDFCELLFLLPNTIHLGQKTGADSAYSEVRAIQLQFSSNQLFIPTSVSFKTKREPYTAFIPKYEYTGKTAAELTQFLENKLRNPIKKL